MQVFGLDIGGANIKLSDADGNTRAVPFPMWVRRDELQATVQSLIAEADGNADMVALTMTAELADCFASKDEGVCYVIDAIEEAIGQTPLRIWLTSGEFAEADDARELTMLVAAANWHALATWSARAVPDGPGLLIDIGSTTTDIIPLLDGQPVPRGLNDFERLQSGELTYTGGYRTPVQAIVQSVSVRGTACPVAAENFATIADAAVVGGQLPEDPENTDTSDHRPFTRLCAQQRLARMLCCDATELTDDEISNIASQILDQQQQQLQASAEKVMASLEQSMQDASMRSLEFEKPVVLFSGSGTHIARRLIETLGLSRFTTALELPGMFRQPVSEAACAFAVARLAYERCRDDLLKTEDFQPRSFS